MKAMIGVTYLKYYDRIALNLREKGRGDDQPGRLKASRVNLTLIISIIYFSCNFLKHRFKVQIKEK